MKIKEEFALRYDLDGAYIVRRLPDGSEREASPLSETAAMAWECLVRGDSREAAVRAIAGEYEGTDPARISQDLDGLIEELIALGYAEP